MEKEGQGKIIDGHKEPGVAIEINSRSFRFGCFVRMPRELYVRDMVEAQVKMDSLADTPFVEVVGSKLQGREN